MGEVWGDTGGTMSRALLRSAALTAAGPAERERRVRQRLCHSFIAWLGLGVGLGFGIEVGLGEMLGPYISPTSPLYLPYISRISPEYLPYISRTSAVLA